MSEMNVTLHVWRQKDAKSEGQFVTYEAKGVSDFQMIVAQSINPNLLQWKGIEATEALAKSPNAKIVVNVPIRA